MKYPASLCQTSFIAFAFTLLCITVLGVSAWSSASLPQQGNTLQVENKTEVFQVVNATILGDSLQLRLKNVSKKAINGYTLSLGDGGVVQTDYTINDYVIAPEQIEEITLPLSVAIVPNISEPAHKIGILAAVLTDQTSDGNFEAATAIITRRRALKVQLEKMLPLFDGALASPDANLSIALNTLKVQLTSLPEDEDRKLPRATRHGLHDAKDEVRALIDRVQSEQERTAQNNLRQNLIDIKGQVEKRVAKL